MRRRRHDEAHPPQDDGTDLDPAAREALEAAGIAVGEPLARGSDGRPTAYRGLDGRDRHVAVRVLPVPPSDAGAALLRRLSGLRALRHPGLVRVREVLSLPGDRAAVTTDLVAGADLAVVLGARGGLTRSEAARLLDDAGSALAHLHDAGLVHGDVSPGNVMVTTEGGVVLVDLVEGVLGSGTAATAAPELADGRPPTAASDVYALARLLERCAAGSGALRERLASLLPDALDPEPDRRPTARGLAARAHGLARPGAIELPDGARLAAGALRAAAAAPTRSVPKRRGRRPGRGTPGGAGGARVVRRLVLPVLVTVLALAGVAVLTGRGDAVRALTGSGDIGTEASASASAPSSGSQAARDGAVSGAAASPEESRATGTESPVEAAVRLTAERDAALKEADADALAATTVAGAAAAGADAALLRRLEESGERVDALSSELLDVTQVSVPQEQLQRWPSAVGVLATLRQSDSSRSDADGTVRTAPAPQDRRLLLVLVPGPWRVAEVLPAQ